MLEERNYLQAEYVRAVSLFKSYLFSICLIDSTYLDVVTTAEFPKTEILFDENRILEYLTKYAPNNKGDEAVSEKQARHTEYVYSERIGEIRSLVSNFKTIAQRLYQWGYSVSSGVMSKYVPKGHSKALTADSTDVLLESDVELYCSLLDCFGSVPETIFPEQVRVGQRSESSTEYRVIHKKTKGGYSSCDA